MVSAGFYMQTTHSPIFTDWQARHTRDWNRQPLCLQHRLHESPLFSRDALAALIERYPATDSALVLSNRQGDGQRRWREGDIGNVPGHRVIDTIAAGSMWLNLRDVGKHERGYADLLDAAYAEMAANVPGLDAKALKMGILISSPNVQVHYHADLPGQTLWQINGRKRVYVYPNQPPYLTPEALEDISLTGVEFKLTYEPGFDRAAKVFELEPGQMLTWPLNCPHRIDNHDCLNISLTTEHWTDENRRSQKVNLANAVLRRRLGLQPRSRATTGAGFIAKSALQAAWRRSPWGKQVQRIERPIDFRLSPDAPGGYVDTAARYR